MPWIHGPFGGTLSPIMMLDLMNRSSGFFPGQPAPSMPLGLLVFLFSFVLAGIATLAAFFAEKLPQALAAAAGLLPVGIILYLLVTINGQQGGPTFFSQMSGQLSIGAWAYGVAAVALTGVAFLHPELNGDTSTGSTGGVSSVIGGRMEPTLVNRDGQVLKGYQGHQIRIDGTWFRVGHRKFPTVEAAEEHINELVAAAKVKEAEDAAAKEMEKATKSGTGAPPKVETEDGAKPYEVQVLDDGERRFATGKASATTEAAIRRYIDQMVAWSDKRGDIAPEDAAREQAERDAWAEGLAEKRAGLPDGGLVAVWRDFPITRGREGYVVDEISFPSAQDARIYIDVLIGG